MADTSGRLLLLLSLLQSRRDWPGPALAERLGVSARTTRRDIDRLRELGYPVSVRKGPGGYYRLDAGARLPPLLFDDEQAVAIALALQTAPTTVAGSAEAAARALATIRQVLPPRLRRRTEAIAVTALWNPWDLAGPAIDPGVLLALGEAVRGRQVARLDEGPRRWRVEPHRLVVWKGRWHLLAFDLDGGEWRTFRVDRLVPRLPTGPGFAERPLPGRDVGEFLAARTDRGDPPEHWPCRGEVLLDAPASLIARWAPGGAVVEALGPRRCRLILGAWSWAGLAGLVGTFDCAIEVVGPPELAEAFGLLGRRFAAAGTAS